MRLLNGESWRNGYLDAWRGPEGVRIAVRRWLVVEQIIDAAIDQPRDVRRLIDYSREVGPLEVARKVVSRLTESRNEKFAACGDGVVLEGAGFEGGEAVRFFAPSVPRCTERVVLSPELVWARAPVDENTEAIEFAERRSDAFRRWSGWLPQSGETLDQLETLQALVEEALAGEPERSLPVTPTTPIEERRGERVEGTRLKATVFGYGHYVRSLLLTALPPEIEVVTVHEIDPALAPSSFPVVDTSPLLRAEERPDITFVAGYHAAHAPVASQALRRGSWVVSEKPLATTEAQLEELLDSWVEPSQYFSAFQRRYAPVNKWIVEDLAPSSEDPLSYHAIVHEVSLPARHWYRWKASGSRLLSNGCHWIDHFLFLNEFAEVVESNGRRGPNGELVCEIELVNGAYFTMTLTDRGSDRLGVREHTELRVRDRTAVIEDMKSYRCEGPTGLIRREKFHKLASHRQMYRTIARRVVSDQAGDSRASVERSARVVLDLEAMLGD